MRTLPTPAVLSRSRALLPCTCTDVCFKAFPKLKAGEICLSPHDREEEGEEEEEEEAEGSITLLQSETLEADAGDRSFITADDCGPKGVTAPITSTHEPEDVCVTA